MSASKSIARQSARAYREFIRTAHSASVACGVTNVGGLENYCRRRFRQVAERNKELGTKKRLLQKQVEMVEMYCRALAHAPEHAAMTSMLQVLAANVGSPVYQRSLEKGFVDYLDFTGRQRERHEADEVQVSDRQNRLLQVALRVYADNLLALHQLGAPLPASEAINESGEVEEGAIDDDDGGKRSARVASTTSSTRQHDDDLLKSRVAASRAGIDIHTVYHGREQVLVEIDETLNKQVIYVRGEEFDFANEDVERVEVVSVDKLRDTVCHAEWFAIAERLVEAVQAETPLHRSRGTVLVGHGIGGAVAFGMALILQAAGFEIKNSISFGAPKLAECTLQRMVEATSPIRVVISGDPLVELPVTGSSGDVFRHFGEILTIEAAASDAAPADVKRTTSKAVRGSVRSRGEKPKFDIARYHALIHDDTADLEYGEGDEVWDDGDYKALLRQVSRDMPQASKWQ